MVQKKKILQPRLLAHIGQESKLAQTQRQIISYYINQGPATVSDLAHYINLSIPTANKIISELVDNGFVQVYGKKETSGGRQPILYGMHPQAGKFVGVDVQHECVNMGIIDLMGSELSSEYNIPFNLTNDVEKIDELCGLITDFIQRNGVESQDLLSIHINLPGRINPRLGRSFTFLKDTEEKPLAQMFSDRLGFRVSIDNDTRGMAYGEFTHGVPSELGAQNALYLNMSWGMGLGIIIDGKIYAGKSGFSGELGHISVYDNEILCHCGKKGCLQTEISGQALHRTILERIASGEVSILSEKVQQGQSVSLEDIITAINKEDVLCLQALEIIGRKLGKRIAGLINIFNPEVLVIGGALARTGESIRQPVETVMRTYSLGIVNRDTEIRIAALGEKAGVMGSCMMARTRCFEVL
ncbi:MAG: ROK family transcriptional regulator [Porphyromonas sp.]|nr:ROK family transcriptional regulator [Porphyromonas sp.]